MNDDVRKPYVGTPVVRLLLIVIVAAGQMFEGFRFFARPDVHLYRMFEFARFAAPILLAAVAYFLILSYGESGLSTRSRIAFTFACATTSVAVSMVLTIMFYGS